MGGCFIDINNQGWRKTDSDTDAIIINFGSANLADADTKYEKSAALHFWLFGYLLSDTILALHNGGCTIITSQKKGNNHIFESLTSSENVRTRN